MHEDENRGRSPDPVDEASGESFPASDPPAWTAARTGKPAGEGADAACGAEAGGYCEVVGLFRSEADAKPAAEALLSSGFNLVDIGPPRRHGNLDAGIGAPPAGRGSLAMSAALGAAAAAVVAALFLPRGARHVIAAAAGGAVGAVSSQAAARMAQHHEGRRWPPNAVLLRVRLHSPADQMRALAILESQGAHKVHMNWHEAE